MSFSYLYAIGPNDNGPIKIGFSKNPIQRIKTLQTAHPSPLVIHKMVAFETDKIRLVEKSIHQSLSYKKKKGEWFNITPEEAIDFIEHTRITHENVSTGVLKILTS